MPKAKDYMTKKPHMLGSGDDLLTAVNLFEDKGITSAPVITPLGEVIGLMSQMALVKSLVMSSVSKEKHTKIIHFKEQLEKIHFVHEEDLISSILKVLMQAYSHRAFVKDDNDKIVGVISPQDLIRHLSGDFSHKDKKTVIEEMEELQDEMNTMKEKMKDMESYLDVYDSVLQSGVYMLHSADKDGKIIFANEKLHRVLGYDNGELLNKSIFDIYPKTVHSQVKAGLQRVIQEGKHTQVYSSMVKKTGSIIRVDMVSASLKDKKDEFAGTFTISREIESDHLLRSLHGVLDSDRYGEVKDDDDKK